MSGIKSKSWTTGGITPFIITFYGTTSPKTPLQKPDSSLFQGRALFVGLFVKII